MFFVCFSDTVTALIEYRLQFGNKLEEEHVSVLTSRSLAVAWGGEHVPEFSQRVFLVFVSGSADVFSIYGMER